MGAFPAALCPARKSRLNCWRFLARRMSKRTSALVRGQRFRGYRFDGPKYFGCAFGRAHLRRHRRSVSHSLAFAPGEVERTGIAVNN
jgi:hypothetical protein